MMPVWWSWDAAGVIATFIAVVVALFQEKFWKWIHKPKATLEIFDLTSKEKHSTILLSVRNDKDPILDTQIYLMATESINPTDKLPVRKRFVPLSFQWLNNSMKDSNMMKKTIYGEEVFLFFHSIENENYTWVPQLVFGLDPIRNPFDSYDAHYTNYSITFYLQLKGSNYISDYWPVILRSENGTVGGWTASVKQSISVKEFNKLFPNHAKDHFSAVEKRFGGR